MDLLHFTDEPDVLSRLGADLIHLEHTGILTGQADGPAPQLMDKTDQFLIDGAREDLFDHLHRGLVGHPKAVHETGFDAQRLDRPGNVLAAAMDDDGPHADEFHEDDVLESASKCRVTRPGAPAVLDH